MFIRNAFRHRHLRAPPAHEAPAAVHDARGNLPVLNAPAPAPPPPLSPPLSPPQRVAQAHGPKDGDDDDDEQVCRFCREGAEPERPLIHPCACSGSMKYVHEDCMGLWIDRQEVARARGESRCQTCGRAVRYAVVMLPGAPARLNPWQMLRIVLENAAKQVPFAARAAVIMASWAIEVPLATGLMFLSFFHTAQTPAVLPTSPQELFALMETGLLVFLVVGIVFFFVMHVFDVVRLYDEGVLDDEVEALRAARVDLADRAPPPLQPQPPPAQPRAAPVIAEAPVNNNDMAMALDDEAANEIDFEEWFGMRGPIHHLFMSQFVLALCVVSTLIVGYACPASVGRQIASRLLRAGLFATARDTCPNLDAAPSTCTNPALFWLDDPQPIILLRRYAYEAFSLAVGLGAIKLTWDAAALVLDALAARVSAAHAQPVAFASSVCRSVSCVQKILALLFLRTVALPTLLGVVVLWGIMPVTSVDRRWAAAFASAHPVPVLALLWMSGIAYILVVTINIVLLREVVHPAVIESLVRWRVPHNGNQLLPIIVEPTAAQLRRALITWTGYVLSAVVFVVVPARALPVLPLSISWPRMVTLHMLGDVVTFHLWLVNLLAQARPTLKALQAGFFARAARLTGLHGLLVPVPVDPVAFAQAVREDRNAMAPAHWLDPAPPLRQELLRPRSRPRFIALRVVVLLGLTWTFCLAFTAMFVGAPLAVGYALAGAFADVVPQPLATDVRLVFVLGWFSLSHATSLGARHVGRLWNAANRSSRAGVGRVVLGVWVAFVLCVVLPLVLGATACVLMRQSEDASGTAAAEADVASAVTRALARQSLAKVWLLGAVAEGAFLGAFASPAELAALRRPLWATSLRVDALVLGLALLALGVVWLGQRLHAALNVPAPTASRWVAASFVAAVNLAMHGGATVQTAARAWQRLEKDLRNDRYFKGRRFLNFDEQR